MLNLSLLKKFKDMNKNYKDLNYMGGLIGISIGIAIIMNFIGSDKGAILSILLGFTGMILLFIFQDKKSIELKIIKMSIVILFVSFIGFTISAIAFSQPCNWVNFLDIKNTKCQFSEKETIKQNNEQKLNMKGFVKDEKNGIPIKNAKIEISNYNLITFTEKNGIFIFDENISVKKEEKENIKITANSYENKYQKVNLNDKKIKIYLIKKGY